MITTAKGPSEQARSRPFGWPMCEGKDVRDFVQLVKPTCHSYTAAPIS
jgi:hypothetical protein